MQQSKPFLVFPFLRKLASTLPTDISEVRALRIFYGPGAPSLDLKEPLGTFRDLLGLLEKIL